MSIVAFIMMTLFVCLGLLHFYWALGGKSGLDKVIPELDGKPAMEPGTTVTVIVATALTGFGIIAYLLGVDDLRSAPYGNYVIYAGWFLAGIFVLRAVGDFNLVGFFKKVRSSEFSKYDTRYYSPLCLSLGVAFAALAYEQTY